MPLTDTGRAELNNAERKYQTQYDRYMSEYQANTKNDQGLAQAMMNLLSPTTMYQLQLDPKWQETIRVRRPGEPVTFAHDLYALMERTYSHGSSSGIAHNFQALVTFQLDSTQTTFENMNAITKLSSAAFDALDPTHTGMVKIGDLKSLALLQAFAKSENPAEHRAVLRILKTTPTHDDNGHLIPSTGGLQLPNVATMQRIIVEECEISQSPLPTGPPPAAYSATLPPHPPRPPHATRHDTTKPNPKKTVGSHCPKCHALFHKFHYHRLEDCRMQDPTGKYKASRANPQAFVSTVTDAVDPDTAIEAAVATALAAANTRHEASTALLHQQIATQQQQTNGVLQALLGSISSAPEVP